MQYLDEKRLNIRHTNNYNNIWEEVVQKPKMIKLLSNNVHLSPYLDNKMQYEFKKVIGKGGFGRVWKVLEKKTRKTYAMKVMDKAKIITKKSVHSVLN